MRDLKFHLLHIMLALILVGFLSIAITSVLYWIYRAIFNIEFGNTVGFGLTIFFSGIFDMFKLAS